MQLRSNAFTHRGGTRKHNEDAFLDEPETGVWVVADGMGGYQAGDVASRLTCETVAEEVRRAPGGLSAEVLEQALKLANQRIRAYGAETLAGQTLGSTVVALLIQESRYHLFWAGDSRCYLSRQNAISQLSRDHSQVAEMVEQGVLQPSEAERHPLAHVITRALGVDDRILLDYRTGTIREGDIFMLCSDGVSKEFSEAELAAFVGGGEIEEANLAIMHSALVKECNDNITCIIVNVNEGCYSAAISPQTEDPTVPVCFRYSDGS